ncbi:carbohydrate ABC transporter, N-acetylglucosamine/diacetylchitobiose-binding protein [Brachybacterium ginsengisoli]|uniref:Carbohydrate ABC transporter, N-acetylglucosamine/diacetylchitobiose-binding protein n=1 Tax=Brachybacterium ginsengisoli TaxID=1331682 RepID=A0A291GV68_9MICO|nr:N-acetylglucosamine/diacetylchitobiose ABC transporter substrate-binding protein [Brachybacterium ginsengisoli]ATG54125.1 carbohydrate ABC transporter, N-acetylglucosamine/diacetylchitobiose-binding protein [Brachybacterium ginsengisoli]
MDPQHDPLLETPLDRLGSSRRRFLSLASLGTGAVALSACATGGGGGDEGSSDGGGGAVAEGGGEVSDDNPFGLEADSTVDVVIFNGGYGDQYAKDAGEEFQKLYPEATAKVSSTVNIQSDLQPRFIGGDPPDLFDNSGAQSMNASALISEGSLAELGALIDAPSLDGGTIGDSLLPGVLVPGTYSGKLYALNYMYTVFALWYSAKQFEEKGWKAPATWDDVMTIGEAAKKEDLALFAWGGQNAADYYHELALSMAIKEGGPEVAKALDTLDAGAYEQPTVVDAFAAIEEAVKAGYFLSGGAGIKHTEAQTEWVTGSAVLYPSGSWIENEQRSTTPEDYAMTGVATPMLSDAAAMGAGAIHGAAGEPFMVPSKAANGAGGLEFLRVMLSKAQCENFSKLTSSMTIVKDTIPEDGFGSTALSSVSSMIDTAGEDVFTFNFSDWYGMGETFKPLWAEFLNGDVTADEARERSQKAVDTIREDDSIEKFDVE